MARFAAIPDVPTTAGAQWEAQILDALKQNVELLAGLRREGDQATRAVTKGMIRVNRVPLPVFTRVQPFTVRGEGVNITPPGVDVPLLADYGRLLTDVGNLATNVQQLAVDVQNLRAVLDALISQLRG